MSDGTVRGVPRKLCRAQSRPELQARRYTNSILHELIMYEAIGESRCDASQKMQAVNTWAELGTTGHSVLVVSLNGAIRFTTLLVVESLLEGRTIPLLR